MVKLKKKRTSEPAPDIPSRKWKQNSPCFASAHNVNPPPAFGRYKWTYKTVLQCSKWSSGIFLELRQPVCKHSMARQSDISCSTGVRNISKKYTKHNKKTTLAFSHEYLSNFRRNTFTNRNEARMFPRWESFAEEYIQISFMASWKQYHKKHLQVSCFSSNYIPRYGFNF